MKTQVAKLQSCKVALIMALWSFNGLPGFCQYWQPIKAEYQIGTSASTNVKNTGTDVIFVPNPLYPAEPYPGCWLQVSVCDGDNAGFGWRIENTTYFLPFATSTYLQSCQSGFTLTDPDVVVAFQPGHFGDEDFIFAKVVGIDPEGYTRTITYEYDASTRQFEEPKNCPCRYGAVWGPQTGTITSGFTLGRRCSSPNIDANEAGETVITWTETEEYYVEVTLGIPFPVPLSPQYWKLKRGNVLAAVGDINDTCLGCSIERRIFDGASYPGFGDVNMYIWNFPSGVIPGFPVTYQTGLGNTSDELLYPAGWYANSDVAISEKGDSSILSFVFMNHLYSGGGNPLHITQFMAADSLRCPHYLRDYNCFTGYPGGRPRIAAPTTLNPGSSDFHVVLGFSGSAYDCETHETSFSSNMGVLGVVGNVPINGCASVNIIDNADLTKTINYDPCICYTSAAGDHGVKEYLAISWTHWPTDSTFTHEKGDIIAKLYQTSNGDEIDPKYSFVNQYLAQGQGVPSIAARRDVGTNPYQPLIAYNWTEPESGNLEIKHSTISPGLEKLEGTVLCIISPERPAKANSDLTLFPNPTKESFSILKNASITPENMVDCELVDILGRKIPTQMHKELMKVQTKGPLAPGIYKVKLVTKEGVFHTNLEIKH